MTTPYAAQFLQDCDPKTNHIRFCDMPEDVLILIFTLLHGQDVARCIPVCRRFSDLIYGNISLQYSVELAMNGMVDGQSSALPVSDKLQRLRKYSLDFESGDFLHQDPAVHLDYILQNRELGWPHRHLIHPAKPSSLMFTQTDRNDGTLYLSHFVPGSAHGGVLSSRSLFAVRSALTPDLVVAGWAVDDAQDLLVIAHFTHRLPSNVIIRCYALSSLTMDSTTPKLHPATTLPVIRLRPFYPDITTITGCRPNIIGPYLILETCVAVPGDRYPHWWSYVVDVYNWKTGQLVSRTDIGRLLVTIVPLDEQYMLLFPSSRMPNHQPNIRIYSFAPSSPPSSAPEVVPAAARHVCTLELPPARPGERVAWSEAKSGDRPSEECAGHFRTDMARSIVSLYIHYEGVEHKGQGEYSKDPNEDKYWVKVLYAYAMHLLIPRATLAAQIQAAESAPTSQHAESNAGSGAKDEHESNLPPQLVVPWADWGARGTLRLYQRGAIFNVRQHIFGSGHHVVPAPFGSRFPFVVPGSDSPEESAGAGGVYVFDVNPLVARSSRGATSGAGTAIVNAEDIEKVLPGVVDPQCATIPYVVYRFPLPYPNPPSTDGGVPGLPVPLPEIRAVTMSMAGFTVQFNDSVEYEKQFQTCTV